MWLPPIPPWSAGSWQPGRRSLSRSPGSCSCRSEHLQLPVGFHDDWRVSAPVLVDAARKWSGHLATAAVGALGGQGEVEESGGDLFATPRDGGKEVARWDELPGDVFVVWLPGVEFDPCPPAVWEWPLGPSVAWGVPDVLAGQVAAGGHPGPGFLGDLAHKGVAGGLTRFRAGRQEGC